METLCLPYPKAECKGLVTFILQKFLRSAEFQWFNGWQLEVSPKNQQAIRLWCRVSTMNSWQSTCPRYHKRHMGTVEATQIFIIYEIYMVNSIHCYQQFTYGQGLSGFCLQAFISFASRHLDLGLCRTCWIGCIHPVNFQSWPLEESIFLGYFFGYLTMYMMWYKKIICRFFMIFLFQSSWIFNRPLLSRISSAKTPQMAYNGTPSQACHKHSYYSWQLLSQLPGYWVYNGLKHSTPVLGYQCRSIKGVAILEPNILPKFPYH